MESINNILDAWIMVEHLSDGEIEKKGKEYFDFHDLSNDNDFFTFLSQKMSTYVKKYNIECSKESDKDKYGLIVCFEIFDFDEVLDFLREEYKLEKTYEYIKHEYKFSLAVYFDKNLNYLKDKTFYTEAAYIRKKHKIPTKDDLQEYENQLRETLARYFDGENDYKERFNDAFQNILDYNDYKPDNCRIKFLKNVESDETSLHSFFIKDLEMAREANLGSNLYAYIYGLQGKKINLDVEKNKDIFWDILSPYNFPLGRFLSSPKYAPYLMQQVAINLSTGYDNQQIRSVNGPPGTGKTTLLKDIFAELVVQQAYDISMLEQKTIRGTDATKYYGDNGKIGELPSDIAENGIIVASSNNGAVQNIVNELPLIEKVDESLVDILLQADYFKDISNDTKLSISEDDDKINENNSDKNEFWGLFSMEGGKSSNMKNIISAINKVIEYLEGEYVPCPYVYDEFINQYKKVQAIREKAQKTCDAITRLKTLEHEFTKNENNRLASLNQRNLEINASIEKNESMIQEYNNKLSDMNESKDDVNNAIYQIEKAKEMIESQKPRFFTWVFNSRKRHEWKDRYNNTLEKLAHLREEAADFEVRIGKIKKNKNKAIKNVNSFKDEKEEINAGFFAWKEDQIEKQNKLKATINPDIPQLDMELDYDKLQKSNPWFTEEYRYAQSMLFINALKVRKQFLYENKSNIKAAKNIWIHKEEHIDNKRLIIAAWNWINLTIPVISSTFASFGRMCKYLPEKSLGHLFIDEAGQAVPQAAVGAIYRSRHVMAVGDPSQIKPVLTLDSRVLKLLQTHFEVSEKYLSDTASVQSLMDQASQYGYCRNSDSDNPSYIGIPLWVHRRCKSPMFDISNNISYGGKMVQGKAASEVQGKCAWFDVKGNANEKYVEEQGKFLSKKIQEMIEKDPDIRDKSKPDKIYVISPFKNVADKLAEELKKIGFTRRDKNGKPTNVGTVHTFQGKEAPIVFLVLGADSQSEGAARWAVTEPNIMNVAATRAEEEFYIIGDRELYRRLRTDVIKKTDSSISKYIEEHPEKTSD